MIMACLTTLVRQRPKTKFLVVPGLSTYQAWSYSVSVTRTPHCQCTCCRHGRSLVRRFHTPQHPSLSPSTTFSSPTCKPSHGPCHRSGRLQPRHMFSRPSQSRACDSESPDGSYSPVSAHSPGPSPRGSPSQRPRGSSRQSPETSPGRHLGSENPIRSYSPHLGRNPDQSPSSSPGRHCSPASPCWDSSQSPKRSPNRPLSCAADGPPSSLCPSHEHRAPFSPTYPPSSPVYTPTSPAYNPHASPVYTPARTPHSAESLGCIPTSPAGSPSAMYTPSSTMYHPGSPTYDPHATPTGGPSAIYTPARAAHNAESPACSPVSPTCSPASPAHSPSSPMYHPCSPAHSPFSPACTPVSPAYSPDRSPIPFTPAAFNDGKPSCQAVEQELREHEQHSFPQNVLKSASTGENPAYDITASKVGIA